MKRQVRAELFPNHTGTYRAVLLSVLVVSDRYFTVMEYAKVKHSPSVLDYVNSLIDWPITQPTNESENG